MGEAFTLDVNKPLIATARCDGLMIKQQLG